MLSAEHACSWHTNHQMTAPAGQSHNRRRRRRPLDSSLAVAAVGALSATLALAFTTPLAPHTHRDRCHQGSVPSNSCFRPRQQPQDHASCMSRYTRVPCRGSGLPGSRSMRRTRQHAASCLSFGAGRAATARDAVVDGANTYTAGSVGNRPCLHLYASSRKEAAIVEQEELEGAEGGGAGTEAVQHRGAGDDEAADAGSSAAAGLEEGAPTKRKRRRPPAYWSSDDNVRHEVAKFWAELGIASDKIPNQTLLHFFGAHALKYGIAMRGGVNDCADWLGVQAIPGKWSVALQEDEVAQLRKDGKLGGGDIERGAFGGGSRLIKLATKDWPSRAALEMGNRASASKHMLEKCGPGYWTKGNNFEREVLSFNTHFQLEEGLPAVWMVKLIDMANNGRRDMVNAIQRAGGYDAAVERLGLVHPIEWKSFADQLDTLRELKDFLTEDGVLQKRMPALMALQDAGRTRLRKKIVLLGGRKLLARRMGLQYRPGGKEGSQEEDGLEFGRFDLGFAVDVLEYVHEQELQRSPVPRPPPRRGRRDAGGAENNRARSKFKFRPPAIVLPRRDHLLAGGAASAKLVEQIEYYGGYENVARRLHLGYHYEDELRYQEEVREELKVQNEMYGKVRERNLETRRNKLAKLKVRLHMKRMNYEREKKLADGLRQREAAGEKEEEEEESGSGGRR